MQAEATTSTKPTRRIISPIKRRESWYQKFSHRSKGSGFQIFVKDLVGRTFTFEVLAETTVLELMDSIQGCIGLPVTTQRLIFNGKQLDEREGKS